MFDKFPHTKKLIQELDYEDYLDQTEWLFCDDETALLALSKLVKTSEQLTSSNIPERLAAKERVNKDYLEVGRSIHAFARNEARYQLGLSNESVARLFSSVEIGGARFMN